jgi:hypothetical protein
MVVKFCMGAFPSLNQFYRAIKIENKDRKTMSSGVL